MDELPRVVTAPVNFDRTRASEVGDQLQAALASRSVVIVDMSQTWSCDLAALGELCVAHDLASRTGRELRIVVSSAALLRQFRLAGLDAEFLVYPSLSLASRVASDGSP